MNDLALNYIDLLLVLVALSAIWSCIRSGFILSFLELLSWLGSLVLAFLINQPISTALEHMLPALGAWTSPLCFILSTLLFKLALDRLSAYILYSLPPGVHRSIINKALGLLPGLVNGLLWAGFLGTFLLLLPISPGITSAVQESRLASKLVGEVGWLGQRFSDVFSEAISEHASTTVKVGAEEPIKLPYTVKKSKIRPDLEAGMLVLVNKERVKRGLRALKADPELRTVARRHSNDMFNRGYFSHISPEGLSPFDRMASGHVSFLLAGENLALAQTLQIAHAGLMKSPGHRANILNPGFGRLGIGVLDGGIYGLMFTQNFRN